MPTSPPARPRLDAFCSDVPAHWPTGKIPKPRPRARDLDAPPPPARPGDGYACSHEAALDRMTREEADAMASMQVSGVLIGGRESHREWLDRVAERVDATPAVPCHRVTRLSVDVPSLVPRPLSGRAIAVGRRRLQVCRQAATIGPPKQSSAG